MAPDATLSLLARLPATAPATIVASASLPLAAILRRQLVEVFGRFDRADRAQIVLAPLISGTAILVALALLNQVFQFRRHGQAFTHRDVLWLLAAIISDR
jgi:hypothetical protein